MMPALNILVVEDDSVTALALSSLLRKEGYQVIGTVDNGPAALSLFRDQPVDLVLMDVNIRGDLDGIQTASNLLALRPVPLIYLTALSDRATLDRAKTTFPAAYIVKPFRKEGVRAAIELAIQNFSQKKVAPRRVEVPESDAPGVSRETILQIDTHIFIRQNYQFLKVKLSDILFLQADDNYIVLQTNSQKFALRMPLASALERIHYDKLVRVHRSYVINVGNMDSFTDTEITMGKHLIPIGKNYKSEFLRYFEHL